MKKQIMNLKKIEDIKINIPEQAYTLGFIWGDGSLNKVTNSNLIYPRIEVEKNDFDQIIDLFKCWGNWSIFYRHRKKRKEQGNACLCDTRIGWFLMINDYLSKSKVSPHKILSLVPDNLKHYWWRGYCDADGCFYVGTKSTYQLSIAGSFEQDWSEAELLFNKLEIQTYKISRRTQQNVEKTKTYHNSIIRITNKKDICKFGNYIYKGNEMGLLRKFEKFKLFL